MLLTKRMFFRNIIKSLYHTITGGYDAVRRHTMASAAPFAVHSPRDPYISRVAEEYGVEYDPDLARVWVNSATGRVDTIENVYRLVSEIHKCEPVLFDRFTKCWFFKITDTAQ